MRNLFWRKLNLFRRFQILTYQPPRIFFPIECECGPSEWLCLEFSVSWCWVLEQARGFLGRAVLGEEYFEFGWETVGVLWESIGPGLAGRNRVRGMNQ